MRAVVLAVLLTVAGAAGLLGQEAADTLAGQRADTLAAQPPDTLAAQPPDTLAAQPPDTLAQQADTTAAQRPDSLAPGAGGPPPDSAAALPDTTLQKIRQRSPLFPEDVDPYTPAGLGRPALTIERDAIRGWPAHSLAELLPRLTPLALDDQGGPGLFQDLHFASGGPAATRILIDGRPLESPLDLAADLRTIPLGALERIELYPGSSAVPGGAEAGWINLVTRTHLTPQANSALAFELGSFNRRGFAGSLGRWLGSRLSVFASLHFDDGDTFAGASADRSRFWGKARFYLSRAHFVEAGFGTSQTTTDTRRTTAVETSPFTGAEDRGERRFQVLYRGRLGPALASASFFSDRFEEKEGFLLDEDPQVEGAFDRRGARGSVRLAVGAGHAEAGIDWRQESLDSDAAAFLDAGGVPLQDSEGSGFEPELARAAVYAGAEQVFDSLSIAAHARLERFDRGAGSVTEPAFAAEARYAAPGGFTPYARLGRAARFPSVAEQAVLAREGGPEAIVVATSRELRAGSAWSGRGVRAEIGAFDRRGTDVALWLPPTGWRSARGQETLRIHAGQPPDSAPGRFADLNMLDLRARGLDLAVRGPLLWGIQAEAIGQLQSVDDVEGNPVPYVAGQHAVGRLEYEDTFFPSGNLRVRAALDTRFTGKRETREGEELPAHAQLDGLLRVQLIGFTFGLSAQNLLDLRYRTEERFLLPGRIVGFEVFWEFWN
jgi:hypothetical protein